MSDIIKHLTAPTRCGHCGREVDASTNADGSTAPPGKGDLSICLYCAELNIYDEHQQLTAVNDVTSLGIDYDTLLSIRAAIALAKRNAKYVKPA